MHNVGFKNPFKNSLHFESGFFFHLTAAPFKCKIIYKDREWQIKVIMKHRKHSQKPITVVQLSGGPQLLCLFFSGLPWGWVSRRNCLAGDETT